MSVLSMTKSLRIESTERAVHMKDLINVFSVLIVRPKRERTNKLKDNIKHVLK
jgi:ABC-type tungstate transport system permease subunit